MPSHASTTSKPSLARSLDIRSRAIRVVVDDEHRQLVPVGFASASSAAIADGNFATRRSSDRRQSDGGRRPSPAVNSVNVEPTPGCCPRRCRRPSSRQKRRLIARPRPVPPYLRVVEASTCVKSLEQPARPAPSVMPMPVSLDLRSASSRRRPLTARVTSTRTRAVLGELAGVAEQVEEHLAHLGEVGMHVADVVAAAHLPARCRSSRPAAARWSATSCTSVATSNVLEEQLHLARPRSSTGRGCRRSATAGACRPRGSAPGRAPTRRARRRSACLLQHLAVADDGVERGAQLVAHVGQELALGAAGGLGRVLGAQQRLLDLLLAVML